MATQRVIIEVSGGCVSAVYGDDVEYILLDLDNVKAGDAPPTLEDYRECDMPLSDGEDALAEAEDDWRPMREDGLNVHHDALGYYLCDGAEARREEITGSSCGFDGRPHYVTKREAFLADAPQD